MIRTPFPRTILCIFLLLWAILDILFFPSPFRDCLYALIILIPFWVLHPFILENILRWQAWIFVPIMSSLLLTTNLAKLLLPFRSYHIYHSFQMTISVFIFIYLYSTPNSSKWSVNSLQNLDQMKSRSIKALKVCFNLILKRIKIP